MKITVLPFESVLGLADIATSEIFMSMRAMVSICAQEHLAHELAHILSGEPDHTNKFNRQLQSMGYVPPPPPDTFKLLRKRLGAPPNVQANVGNVTGIQNILLDLHLLAAYRKFSKKILGTEGHWEVLNEGGEGPTEKLIRLYPTPKGAYPVVVVYYPIVSHFRSPQARKMCMDMALAEAKQVLGASRRKLAGFPTPDGGTVQYDGDDLVQEGLKESDEIIEKALQLGEPDRIFTFSALPWLLLAMTLSGSLIT